MQRILLLGSILILSFFFSFTVLFTWHQNSVLQAIEQGGCIDIPALPNYAVTRKTTDAINAVNQARIFERLPTLRLPVHFYELDAVQQQFILVNLERTDRGLPALHFDNHLAQVARAYGKQLSDLKFFSHTSPVSGTFGERVNNNPALAHRYTLAAENLAGNPVAGVGPIYEYMYNDTADACGHRYNILNPGLTLIGIGVVSDKQYGSISVQEFLAPSTTLQEPRQQAAPRITIDVQNDGRVLSCEARVTLGGGTARVTWFVDRVEQPAQLGRFFTLDLRSLPPGRHIIYAYVVDSVQNYAEATYRVDISNDQSSVSS
jgi:hypothetical protein